MSEFPLYPREEWDREDREAEEKRADARLIAAAPALLAAAEAALEWFDSTGYLMPGGSSVLAQLRAAIDAAGGTK